MKKGLLYIAVAVFATFSGCIVETDEDTCAGITVTFGIDDIIGGSASSTRSTIPPEQGETNVKELYLLFFRYMPDGGGSFVKYYMPDRADMNGRYTIPFDGDIISSQNYTILAIANISDYTGNNFLGDLNGMTERQVIERTTLKLSGVGTEEGDNSKAIASSNLAMSGRVVRMNGENAITVSLTRCLARFDVRNDAVGYDLVSASIWGAASGTPVWHDRMTITPERMERFYGITRTSDFTDIKGKLYAFENFVSKPEQTDKVTTCLILGLKKTVDPLSETFYYRVNINQTGSSQNLLRNHVYTVRINSVEKAGAESEYNAWTDSETKLNVSISEWNSDDNGLALTDGVNTLVIPVKRVHLNAAGDMREYKVFTKGTGTLVISKKQLPKNISATLDGDRLHVSVNPLGEGKNELRGTIELSFAGLRGTITFTQSLPTSRFFSLNRYEIPEFASLERTSISDNIPFTVTASGPWTATIHNIYADNDNPGFSFYPFGKPVTMLTSADNPFINMFQIYTTGDNPTTDKRNGFMVISLDEDSQNHNFIIVLTQKPVNNP